MTETPRKKTPQERNPTGRGGFKDNPQNRNPGGYKRVDTFRFWFDSFKDMTEDELDQWKLDNPPGKRKIVAKLALKRIERAEKDLKEFQEVADRSEGKAPQSIDVTTQGESLNTFDEQQIDRIAERISRRGRSVGDSSS